ncbi:Cytochrome c oxidase subunit 7A2 mitochondrial protein [Rutstroemia sp. NJR-2017a BVV2]|nr:Cytochrome c oxidase subunit 7A2 mitochondrial protein [Rutstroemia sp. NJR-2017a BVV2]
MAGFVNRENRVPHYQRLFQEGAHKHIRQWNQKQDDALPILRLSLGWFCWYVYLSVYAKCWIDTGTLGSMYMMSRMVLGHKTWFGKG